MDKIIFRRVIESEVAQLKTISVSTFSESFGKYNTGKDMDMYLSEKMSSQQLKEELSNPESEFYFAVHQDKILGYLKINIGKAQNEKLGVPSLEIERIYIIQSWQGKGLGTRLLDFAVGLAKERKLNKVWLGVWEENKSAMRLYTKYGFKKFGSHPFLLGEDLQTDILMEKNL